ncbi:hypothetical protein KOR42_44410 [Thalassoglobus neptunius]|uniref:Uncharacterized protein n=1 Tax=Thalassoglobus neptunius TaxID=1938619 RepID=A0A5C5W0Q0_9PLAN|nr:hypothetical protein KOR42_44410 [Thalassoglobus neptunius]
MVALAGAWREFRHPWRKGGRCRLLAEGIKRGFQAEVIGTDIAMLLLHLEFSPILFTAPSVERPLLFSCERAIDRKKESVI